MIEVHSTQHLEAVSCLRKGLIENPHLVNALLAVSEQTGVPVDTILARTITEKKSIESYARKLLVFVLNRIMGFSAGEIAELLDIYRKIPSYSLKQLDKLAASNSYMRVDQEALTQKLKIYA